MLGKLGLMGKRICLAFVTVWMIKAIGPDESDRCRRFPRHF